MQPLQDLVSELLEFNILPLFNLQKMNLTYMLHKNNQIKKKKQ